MFAIVLLTLPLGLLLYAVGKRALSRSPPGPFGMPGLGLLPTIMWRTATNSRHRFFLYMQELRNKYGDVVSFAMGTQEFVLISGYETLREAFVTNADKLIGRPNTNFHRFLFKEAGIAGSEGALWQEHRRFALRVLKDFGFGRNVSELQIQEEAEQVVAILREKDGQKIDPKKVVSKAVANVITQFIFSEFSSHDSPDLDEFMEKLVNVTNTSYLNTLTVFYRSLSVKTANALSSANKTQNEAITWIEGFGRMKIEAIRRKYNISDEPSNYVEAYLQEQQKRGDDAGSFTEIQLVRTIWELYVAGMDTSSGTLRWCLLYAALNPDLQDRCHAEILTKIGKRPARMNDKKELHYCQAFLDEVQRISTLAPMSIEHRAMQDTTLHGHSISSDALIFVNLYGLHHDEKLFPEPNTFNPDRFLTPDGQYKQSEFLNQFGIGKRSCLGEVLARMEVFLFFITYMQNFRFLPDTWTPEEQEQILLGTEGVVHAPMDHLLIVSNRD